MVCFCRSLFDKIFCFAHQPFWLFLLNLANCTLVSYFLSLSSPHFLPFGFLVPVPVPLAHSHRHRHRGSGFTCDFSRHVTSRLTSRLIMSAEETVIPATQVTGSRSGPSPNEQDSQQDSQRGHDINTDSLIDPALKPLECWCL